MARTIGIDPGTAGAIAFVTDTDCNVYRMPATTRQKHDMLSNIIDKDSTVVIEKVQVMGKRFGAKQALSYGQGYGELIGILTALGCRIVEVTPSVWKKAMHVTSDKKTSIALCERLFPSVSLYPTSRTTKPHDGLAEALLIAEYGRRLKL